ncbi:hypothetical protein BV22DRAFT_516409 [Leucogyrophana mollusca]|uniref:Uncharacterized protein n=1 Tax=Leucogyrophana mollusca TaxID=85980 RepID=A0ACB8BGC8_9AGAM|nr:hypothetical protein BV22DRAFT_516409 [Leucogyrophana mollusca]
MGCSTVASMCLLVWDILVTFDVEVQHIWPKPRTALFKWVYLTLRYGGLALQIFHQIMVPHIITGNAAASLCKAWLLYAIVTGQVMTTSVEFILMARVYALYNKSRRIASLLLTLFLSEVLILCINSIHTIPNLQSAKICIMVEPTEHIVYYSLTVLLTQSTLLALTVAKHIFARRRGFARTPLVSQLTRDGTVVYAIVSVLILMTGVCCVSDKQLTVIMFFWSTSISPAAGCRLIMNMQRLSRYDDTRFGTTAQFTTDIELDFPIYTTQETPSELSDIAFRDSDSSTLGAYM